MHPTIRDGEAINVEPIERCDVRRGDILLCRGARGVMAHRVVAIKDVMGKGSGVRGLRSSMLNVSSRFLRLLSSILNPQSSKSISSSSIIDCQSSIFHPLSSTLSPYYLFILRGDASSSCDAPVDSRQILGKVVSVERDGRSIVLNSRMAKMMHALRRWASRSKRAVSSQLSVISGVIGLSGEVCITNTREEHELDKNLVRRPAKAKS